ncbi:TonB-dependent receptor [Pedobacter psychrophilus]|uniref:TonB-dependent receptor n=1 Tax=Pedobacter psychrophilus TaxID=1826909 RepID=A0A179DD78_9SPHI|nr:TonB-dependent receptor [Pedobacter psychrophilus]OAQ38660.1 TonB-dependent receptor [Pedobacter psychrophilus]
MKNILLTFLLSLFYISSFAQEITVKGKVVDGKNGSAIGFATVSLLDLESKPVKGGQTDLNGNFAFTKVDEGGYILKISFVGYAPLSKSIVITKEPTSFNLGNLKLEKGEGALLNEVVVTGKKNIIELGIDRKVFNTDQSIVSQGGSATDLLATVPSVQVDLDGNISLRGTSNVRVLIDGKPSTFGGGNITAILQSLPASSIERVELITNPSSKYDAEGQSGIINIVLKKNQKIGLNGSIAITAGRFDNFNGNGSLNYRDQKWNLSGNYSYRTGDRPGSGITNTTFLNPQTNVAPFSYASQLSNRSGQNNTFKVGAERYFSEKTSVALSGNFSFGNDLDRDDLSQQFLNANNTLLDYGTGLNSEKQIENGYDLNLDFSHKFKKPKEEITGNFSYGNSSEDENARIVQDFFSSNGAISQNRISSNRRNDVTNGTNSYNLQLDYTLPLKNESKLEAGYRTTLRYDDENQYSDTLITNTNNYNKDNTQSNLFELDDVVHAVYANYQNQLTKNFGFQFGLRTEQAYLNTKITGLDANGQSLITPSKLDYLRVYPSIFLTQKFKGDNQLQLSYSRRVNRPRGYQTNPFPDRSDRYNIRIGNPNLRPEDIHSFEFSYAKFWPAVTFTSSLYYRQVNDVVQSLRDNNPDELGGTISRYYNLSKNQSVGLELISRADISKKLNVTGNLNFFQTYFKGQANLGINDNSGFSYNGNLTTNYNFSKTLSTQVSAFYTAPRILAQGTFKEILSVDAGLKLDVLKNKASISANIRDILNGRKYGFTTDNGVFLQDWERRRQGRIYSLTFSYRFGQSNFDSKKQPKKTTQPEDDMGF